MEGKQDKLVKRPSFKQPSAGLSQLAGEPHPKVLRFRRTIKWGKEDSREQCLLL